MVTWWETLSNYVPDAYKVVAKALGLRYPEVTGTILFFLILTLIAAATYLSLIKTFGREGYSTGENKAYALIAVTVGGIGAYSIGAWAPTFFVFMLAIGGIFIWFLWVLMYRTARGIAAGIGKMEMEMRKEFAKAEKEFLEEYKGFLDIKKYLPEDIRRRIERAEQHIYKVLHAEENEIKRLEDLINSGNKEKAEREINQLLKETHKIRIEIRELLETFKRKGLPFLAPEKVKWIESYIIRHLELLDKDLRMIERKILELRASLHH